MHKQNRLDQIMGQLTELLVKQWKPLAATAGVVLLGAGGYGLAGEMRAKKERAASNALFEAQMQARKLSAEKKWDEAERAMAGVTEKFKGSRAAFEAELQMGDIWMDAAGFEKAVARYQAALAAAGDSFSRLLAAYSIGIAWESAAKYEQAAKAYGDALGVDASDFLRPEILMAQARCYEALQQSAKAIEIYKTVQDKFSTRSYYSGAASAFEKQLEAGTKKL